jgi:hypothetical protein
LRERERERKREREREKEREREREKEREREREREKKKDMIGVRCSSWLVHRPQKKDQSEFTGGRLGRKALDFRAKVRSIWGSNYPRHGRSIDHRETEW